MKYKILAGSLTAHPNNDGTHLNNYIKNKEERLKNASQYRKINNNEINKKAAIYRAANVYLLRQRDKEYRERNYEHHLNLSRNN